MNLETCRSPSDKKKKNNKKKEKEKKTEKQKRNDIAVRNLALRKVRNENEYRNTMNHTP